MVVRTLDLFCGGGGSSWGARNAGAEIACGVDAWELAAQTFKSNFPEAQVFPKFLTEKSDRRAIRGVGDIDLILASPECMNHTCARGNREQEEASRLTAMYVLRFARAVRPRWIVIENVIQMRSWARYNELLLILRDDLHYYVNEEVLNAAKFGVPQRRRRLFLVCDREKPPPRISPPSGVSVLPAAGIVDPQGTWNWGPLYSKKRAKPTLERAERAIAELGSGVPFLIVYYSSDGAGGWQRMDTPLRTMTTLDRFGLVQWDGNTPMLRMLQLPELTRAMGFNSGYKLSSGTRRDRIKLLGNGVCPPVMEAIVSILARQEHSQTENEGLFAAAE